MNSKNKSIDLSVVVPALNEELRIGASLDALAFFLKADETMKNLNCEVLVVCANGSDKTAGVAISHGKSIDNFQVLRPGKRIGKGRDVRFGMLKAKGRYAMFMDADLATPLHHIPKFYNIADSGYEIVVATRNLKKHHTHLPRRILSMTGNLMYRILGGVWTEDTQCGFKMFSKEAVKICFGKQTIMKWGFDMELLTIAKTNKLKTKYIRINDWEDKPGGTFASGQIIRHAVETLRELLVILNNRITGKYRR